MEHTKKMVLIPPHLLQNLTSTSNHQVNPIATQVSNLDTQMQDILNNSFLPADQKVILYQNTLHRYQTLNQKLNAPTKIEIQDT